MINFTCKHLPVLYLTVLIALLEVMIFPHCNAEMVGIHGTRESIKLYPGLTRKPENLPLNLFTNINYNPNSVQNLMAKALIKSATNLFGGINDCMIHAEDSSHSLNALEGDKKASVVEETIHKTGNAEFVKRYEFSRRELRSPSSARSMKQLLEDNNHLPLVCRDRNKRNVKCHQGNVEFNIVLPKNGMSRRSVRSLVRKIYYNLKKAHGARRKRTPMFPMGLGGLKPFKRSNDQSNNILKVNTNKETGEGNDNSQNGLKGIEELNNFLESIRKRNYNLSHTNSRNLNLDELNKNVLHYDVTADAGKGEGPPADLLISDKDKGNIRCKWLSKRQNRLPRYFHELYEVTTRCFKGRCKKKFRPTPRRCSVNDGKTARIIFPASHRCVLKPCPCFVTTAALPPRTPCSPEELPPLTTPVPRCQGMDLTERTEPNVEAECTTKSTTKSCTTCRKKRSCGCKCCCGCSCHSHQNQGNPLAANGRAPCGCGCPHAGPSYADYQHSAIQSKASNSNKRYQIYRII